MRAFYFLLIVVLVSSCKKDVDPVISVQSNFRVEKNDENWISSNTWANYSVKEQRFYINASKRDSRYYQEEILSISVDMTDFTQPLTTTNFSSEWYYIIGGDVIAGRYTLDKNSTINEIQITSVDTEKKIITGKFSVYLIHDSWYSNKGESLEFSSGTFSISYSEIE